MPLFRTCFLTYDERFSGDIIVDCTDGWPNNTVKIDDFATAIAEGAFEGKDYIEKVIFPKMSLKVGSYAFRDCINLIEIEVDEECEFTEIGDHVFYGCNNLSKIVAPSNVASKIVKNCDVSSVDVEILGNFIDELAFIDCRCLNSITIPDTIIKIGGAAFRDCINLNSVKLGNRTTSIGYEAFKGCISLKSLTIPESVRKIEGHAFNNCTGLTSITIPQNVVYIGESAFYNCTGLTSIRIPKSVRTIENRAFDAYREANLKVLNVYYEGTAHEWSKIMGHSTRNMRVECSDARFDCSVGVCRNWEYKKGR